MPTRLPYGLSFVKPGANSGEYTFTAGDQTPDVSLGTFFQVANSGITITRFDGGERGKIIYVYSASGSLATIQNSAGGIRITNIVTSVSGGAYFIISATAGNATILAGETLPFIYDGSDWSYLGTRFVVNTQV